MEPLSRWPHRTPLLQGADPSPRWQLWLSALVDTVNLVLQTVIGVGQVQFPAIQNPSTDVNVLDYYGEGTWTPTDASGAGLVFTSVVNSQYVKIGSLVYVAGTVTYPATANGAGAEIGGLPFTVLIGSVPGLTIAYKTEPSLAYLALAENGSSFVFYDNAGLSVTNATMSGDRLDFSGCYRASA